MQAETYTRLGTGAQRVIIVTGRINILRKFEEMKQLHCEQKRTEVSFKIP
jgi:hypothetical protein